MPKIQNTFQLGIIDSDSDNRFVGQGKLIDAENFMVNVESGADAGVGKNILGNIKRTNYAIAGAKTIGRGVDTNSGKVYNFIKGTTHDYIYEYDSAADSSEIVLQSSTGTRLNFIDGERIKNVDVIIDPEGDGNLLAFSGDSNPPRIINIERAKTWGLDGFTAEEIMLAKAPPLYPVTLGDAESDNPDSNNLEDRFPTFAYRYRYRDGYVSCPSSWTRYFFEPGPFDLNFETFENNGMLNIRNAVNLTFNTGPREVVGVDLLFRLSNTDKIKLIEKFVKLDQGWGDNTSQTITFDNSKVYSDLPQIEYQHSYDNVPHEAGSQTVAGNRLMFGDYIEQYDMIDKNGDKVVPDYTVGLVSNPISSDNVPTSGGEFEYSYESPPVLVENALIIAHFINDDGPLNLIKDSAIFINFSLKAERDDDGDDEIDSTVAFDGLFSYILEDDYTNLADLIANSGFVAALAAYQEYFEDNGGITIPDDSIATTVLQGFSVTVVATNFLVFKLPVVKYEIDNSPDPNTFVYDYFTDVNSVITLRSIASATSMKSYRSYQVGQIFRDLQGRKTSVFTSNTDTLFIPIENSVNQNQLQVTIPDGELPPVWADTYKFVIKENKGHYEQIIASIFFVDGTYRWVKLDGENKNKVKEGDVLTVKKDSGGALLDVVKIKVLEIKQQDKNFLEDNLDPDSEEIIEPAGLYMKISSGNFEMNYDPNEFLNFEDHRSSNSLKPYIYLGGLEKLVAGSYVPIPIGQGSTINLRLNNFESGGEESTFVKSYIAQIDYDSFEDFYADVIEPTLPLETQDRPFEDITFVRGYFSPLGFVQTGSADDNLYMKVHGVYSGTADEASRFDGYLNIRNVDGYFIFETQPIEIDEGIWYETPEVYDIVDGEYTQSVHLLTETFNCYAFGNGCESYQIRDAFNEKSVTIDFSPTGVIEGEYRQVRRFADITYSGVYNSETNVNGLSEFNLALAPYKNDMEKRYGPIYKLAGRDTDLLVCQEDRDSKVFYGKDLLFNADGATNLTGVPYVLGQQDTYVGDYGISTHSESYDFFGTNYYHADVKRGVVVKNNANSGLFEITSQGMRNHFKELFKLRILNIIGVYDQYGDTYILNIKYLDDADVERYQTWTYSDRNDGWLCKQGFNPEAMVRVNSRLYSFFEGEIYEHNQESAYNYFYGQEVVSSFTFVFNQSPSERKHYRVTEIEGTIPLDLTLSTDLDKGYINAVDFVKEEGVWYGYNRTSNTVRDTALLATQGIGESLVATGLVISFNFELDPIVSVGDEIRTDDGLLVGVITSKTATTLTLNTVNNYADGAYLMCCKPQSVEVGDLVGYMLKVVAQFESTSPQSIYAINNEVNKSFS